MREQDIGQCCLVLDVIALKKKNNNKIIILINPFSKDRSVRCSGFDCHFLTDKPSAVPSCTVTEAGMELFVFPLDVG